jgi:hypothetical protein
MKLREHQLPGHCGTCSYHLQGLPAEGRCPECGAPYGPDILIIWGNAGERKRFPLRIEITIFIVWLMGALVVTASAKSFYAFGLIGIMGLFWGFRIARGWRGWQVRLSPLGYGMRWSAGEMTLRPWNKDDEIDLRKMSRTNYLFTVRHLYSLRISLTFECSDMRANELRGEIERISRHGVCLET